MDVGLLIAAAEVHEEAHSTTPFVVAGLILAAFAVIVATIGILRPNLGDNVSRLFAAVGTVLVVVTMAAMIVIS
jgi:hypothetical protein